MSISPEFRDVGSFAGRKMVKLPEKTNFNQTCNLLSQYLKAKGSFGDLSFASPRDLGKSPAMDLFPQRAGFGVSSDGSGVVFPTSATDLSEMKQGSKPKTPQMTIIYGGKVLVFDDISEEKVKEVMMLASKGNLQSVITPSSSNLDLNSAGNIINPTEERIQRPIQAHVSGLPLARKASLHRFLEKRKDRVNARAPYQVNISTAVTTKKPEETKTWLGLASQSSTGLRL
ncbi:Tify 10b [Thalictrum thalictroides]|uniref:Protein TIFY n=1 Tax=Thalictrum thalictroides TaxID=46969 RepID=A0A7J6VI10_THATH|nr:Tify 10b [Thalictrum thalictroides]